MLTFYCDRNMKNYLKSCSGSLEMWRFESDCTFKTILFLYQCKFNGLVKMMNADSVTFNVFYFRRLYLNKNLHEHLHGIVFHRDSRMHYITYSVRQEYIKTYTSYFQFRFTYNNILFKPGLR